MASFRKRGKYWSFRVRVKSQSGEWKEYTGSGYSTKPEAREAAINKEAELKSAEGYIGNFKFKNFGPLWLDTYVKDKLKPITYKTYRNAVEDHAMPIFGHQYLKDITPIAYQKFIDGIIESGLAKSTARRIHNALNQCMKRAVLSGYIKRNPCENVVIKKLEVKKLKFIEPSLIPQLLEYIYRRNYTYGLFFETLFESGMRKGECAGLRLDDINWRENKLIVDETLEFQRENYMRKLKTYVKYRTEQKMLVGELYHHELNLVFARDDGTPLPKATLWNVFKSAMDHIGHDPLPIHSTRHTHVAMLIEANWDMKSIADRLGHSSPVTTLNTYAHISNKVAEISMDSFEKYMEKLGQ